MHLLGMAIPIVYLIAIMIAAESWINDEPLELTSALVIIGALTFLAIASGYLVVAMRRLTAVEGADHLEKGPRGRVR
jgi:hypothetical protein